jgi:hypothetical protein
VELASFQATTQEKYLSKALELLDWERQQGWMKDA